MVANLLCSKLTFNRGKIEEIELPEQVDVLISEPIGEMLIDERMLESYLHAKKWLRTPNIKPRTSGPEAGTASVDRSFSNENDFKSRVRDPHERVEVITGQMFPSIANLSIVPFNDEDFFNSVKENANFWREENFYGVNLSAVHQKAVEEYFGYIIFVFTHKDH